MIKWLFTFLAQVYNRAKSPWVKVTCLLMAMVAAGLYMTANIPTKETTIESIFIISPPDPVVITVAPEDAVVLIIAMDGVGSGTAISEDGIILTAGHMLNMGLPESVVFYDGTTYTEFESMYVDREADVGLFKIKDGCNIPYLPLGNSDDLEVGDSLWAIGNPFGITNWHCYGYMAKEDEKGRIFLSMPLNPGNSGCPILNECNEIVGICTGGILPGNNLSRGYTSNICAAIVTKYKILFDYD